MPSYTPLTHQPSLDEFELVRPTNTVTATPTTSARTASRQGEEPPGYTYEEERRRGQLGVGQEHSMSDYDVESGAVPGDAGEGGESTRRRRGMHVVSKRSAAARRRRRLRRIWGKLVKVGVCEGGLVIGFVLIIQILYTALGWSVSNWTAWAAHSNASGKQGKQLDKLGGSKDYPYPTDFTRDIVPKPIHSHNDYWRKVPFYEAISYGCISVEADVWKFDGDDEVYVGHDISSLTPNRTLSSLYITPIITLLQKQNPPTTPFTPFPQTTPPNGIFDANPDQTLHLYLDIKTSPQKTYSAILSSLQPLRHPINYLTHFSSLNPPQSPITHGPITIILTGNVPVQHMISSHPQYRETFYDAPIEQLLSQIGDTPLNRTNVLTATSRFGSVVDVDEVKRREGLSDEMRRKVREQVVKAREKGVGIRYWDTPAWPVGTRNNVWRALVEEGVFLLNVDDLEGASKGVW